MPKKTIGQYKGYEIPEGISDTDLQWFIRSVDASLAPTSEPTAFSSSSGQQKFQSNVQPVVASANNAITTAQGVRAQNAKNDAKVGAENQIPSDVQAEMDAGKTDAQKAQEALFSAWDRQMVDARKQTEELILAARDTARATVTNLTGQWQERRRLLEDSNRRSEASWRQQFTRFGQAEYSPGMTGDFLSQKEREGLALVSKLDTEYNNAVSAINAALGEKEYGLAANLSQNLQRIEEKALEQMMKNAEEAAKVNAKMRETSIAASRENAIGNLIQQYGITDPLELQNILNFDESGGEIGDISLDEISKVLKVMGQDASMAGLTADFKTYSFMKKQNDPAVAGLSYMDYVAAINNARRAPKTTKEVDTFSFDEYLNTAEGRTALETEMDKQPLVYTKEERERRAREILQNSYDGMEKTKSAEREVSYQQARSFIEDNPGADWYELRSALLENTGLSATAVDTLLRANGIEKPDSSSSSTSDDELAE